MSETYPRVETKPETSESSAETLSTGIDVLDRKLGGGIPAGQVVALLASPASQSELFLYEMAAARKTLYLTTERMPADIEYGLAWTETSSDEVDIHRLTADDPLGNARAVIEDLADESLLIVDPVDPLEAVSENEYRAFMNDVKARTVETRSLTLLHCLDGRTVPAQRDRTEYHADIVFDLETRRRGSSVDNSLSVPKFRGGKSLSETIELHLTSDVTIDVSRKIA